MYDYINFWIAKEVARLVIFLWICLAIAIIYAGYMLNEMYRNSKQAKLYRTLIIKHLASLDKGKCMTLSTLAYLATGRSWDHQIFDSYPKDRRLRIFKRTLKHLVDKGSVAVTPHGYCKIYN